MVHEAHLLGIPGLTGLSPGGSAYVPCPVRPGVKLWDLQHTATLIRSTAAAGATNFFADDCERTILKFLQIQWKIYHTKNWFVSKFYFTHKNSSRRKWHAIEHISLGSGKRIKQVFSKLPTGNPLMHPPGDVLFQPKNFRFNLTKCNLFYCIFK